LTDDRACGADDAAGALYAGQRLRKLRFLMTDNIERQYEATEPENRLVAAELERRWNTALAHVSELEARIADAKNTTPQIGEEQRQVSGSR
jgi:hypothetical protein